MPITTAVCDTFTRELFDSTVGHNETHTYKIALIKPAPSGTFGASTANYSALSTDEVASGSGYTTGGATLSSLTVSGSGKLTIDFADATWSTASFSAAGALIYNSTKANRAVAVLSFGGTYTGTGGNFTVPMTNPIASS